MSQTRTQSTFLTTGLALFSMFFGAGNLIFPLLIGRSVGGNTWYAVVGLGLTAVIVPFLGLATMVLFQADYRRFFGRIGKIPGFSLLLLLQLILGPLGVIPRLITLMYATAKPYISDFSLPLFSLFIVALILACSFRRERLIGLLGALTPILLLCIAALVFLGLMNGATVSPVSSSPQESFLEGLIGGYNTMDLIAAFIFATVILPDFKQGNQIVFPSIIAASLLFATYVGLCFISALHGWTLDPSIPPEQILSAIATKLLGPAGALIAAAAVIIACLTTAMTLATTFAEYVRKDSPTLALIVTLGLSALVANLGFSGIAAFLGPVLQIVYPGLILLTVLNLAHILYGFRAVKVPVFLTFTCSAIFYLRQHMG